MTLKLDGKGSCRIQRISGRDKEIVTNERYVVMSWKATNRRGKSVTLTEAVDEIISCKESVDKEHERRAAE